MALHEIIAWLGLLFGSGALLTAAKILIEIGERKKRFEVLEKEQGSQATLQANFDQRILGAERALDAYKLYVLQEFARSSQMAALEQKLLDAVQGMREDMRGITKRLDHLVDKSGRSAE